MASIIYRGNESDFSGLSALPQKRQRISSLDRFANVIGTLDKIAKSGVANLAVQGGQALFNATAPEDQLIMNAAKRKMAAAAGAAPAAATAPPAAASALGAVAAQSEPNERDLPALGTKSAFPEVSDLSDDQLQMLRDRHVKRIAGDLSAEQKDRAERLLSAISSEVQRRSPGPAGSPSVAEQEAMDLSPAAMNKLKAATVEAVRARNPDAAVPEQPFAEVDQLNDDQLQMLRRKQGERMKAGLSPEQKARAERLMSAIDAEAKRRGLAMAMPEPQTTPLPTASQMGFDKLTDAQLDKAANDLRRRLTLERVPAAQARLNTALEALESQRKARLEARGAGGALRAETPALAPAATSAPVAPPAVPSEPPKSSLSGIADESYEAGKRYSMATLRALARQANTPERQAAVMQLIDTAALPKQGVEDLFTDRAQTRAAAELRSLFPAPPRKDLFLSLAEAEKARALAEKSLADAEYKRKMIPGLESKQEAEITKLEEAAAATNARASLVPDMRRKMQAQIDKMEAERKRILSKIGAGRGRGGGGTGDLYKLIKAYNDTSKETRNAIDQQFKPVVDAANRETLQAAQDARAAAGPLSMDIGPPPSLAASDAEQKAYVEKLKDSLKRSGKAAALAILERKVEAARAVAQQAEQAREEALQAAEAKSQEIEDDLRYAMAKRARELSGRSAPAKVVPAAKAPAGKPGSFTPDDVVEKVEEKVK